MSELILAVCRMCAVRGLRAGRCRATTCVRYARRRPMTDMPDEWPDESAPWVWTPPPGVLADWQRDDADTEPLTVAEIMGEFPPPDRWRSRLPTPHAQRLDALVRERGRRVDAQDALRRLVRAVEAHRGSVPPRNRRDADRALWDVLDAIGGDDG